MSEEEKKAIEEIIDILNYCNGLNCDLDNYDSYDFNRNELDKLSIILNLIEKQQQELQLKDKVIDEMANYIIQQDTYIDKQGNYAEFALAGKKYVKNSFINKVKRRIANERL